MYRIITFTVGAVVGIMAKGILDWIKVITPSDDEPVVVPSKNKMKPDSEQNKADKDKSIVESDSGRLLDCQGELSELCSKNSSLESENREKTRAIERLEHKLQETSEKIEVSFGRLVKELHGKSSDEEIKRILEDLGFQLYTDYNSFPDGFMRIKDKDIQVPTLIRAALMRGDDLVEPGILHVPMDEPGVEPVHQDNVNRKMNSDIVDSQDDFIINQ